MMDQHGKLDLDLDNWLLMSMARLEHTSVTVVAAVWEVFGIIPWSRDVQPVTSAILRWWHRASVNLYTSRDHNLSRDERNKLMSILEILPPYRNYLIMCIILGRRVGKQTDTERGAGKKSIFTKLQYIQIINSSCFLFSTN